MREVFLLAFPKSLYGYQEEEVAAYLERLKSAQGAELLELECNIENLQEEISRLNQEIEPLRADAGQRREKLKTIRNRIADVYSRSIMSSYELDRRLSTEEAARLQDIERKAQELEKVRQTLEQLCKEIEKLTQGFGSIMEGSYNE